MCLFVFTSLDEMEEQEKEVFGETGLDLFLNQYSTQITPELNPGLNMSCSRIKPDSE